jgi:prepilin-type N-terminal cleavage/methylation domain-containing protein
MKHRKQKKQGFTLIELIVVISIIGLLSSIVLASVVGARAKAVNTQMTETVHQYEFAINSYAVDHNGLYPLPLAGNNGYFCLGKNPSGFCKFYGTYSSTNAGTTNLNALLDPYYNGTPPIGTDPIQMQDGYIGLGALYACTKFVTVNTLNDSCGKVNLIWQLFGSTKNSSQGVCGDEGAGNTTCNEDFK